MRLERRPQPSLAMAVAAPFAAVLASLALCAGLIAMAGVNPLEAYAEMLRGAFGSRLSITETLAPSSLVADAHAAGLAVHVWTLRPENAFLPVPLRSSDAPAAHGDLAAEVRALAEAGVDGVFADVPDTVIAALGRTP